MSNQIKVILKNEAETLGFDLSSILSNPLVSVGMNAVVPGSSMALPLINQVATQVVKKPASSNNLQTLLNTITARPATVNPPPKPASISVSAPKAASAPPPPASPQVQMNSRSLEQIQAQPKLGLSQNTMLFGGIALVGIGAFIFMNNKGKRR
ncbi:hypothetical protein P3G55_20080 [Leptospira sp. 96542]|nr:hypothetical protein [Leptospira sp. 96542]